MHIPLEAQELQQNQQAQVDEKPTLAEGRASNRTEACDRPISCKASCGSILTSRTYIGGFALGRSRYK